MKCRQATLVAAVLAAVVGAGAAQAQTPAEFYKGKDIRVVIGAGVGGTYHLYAMLAARMMRKHIPGQPTITLMAMPGAGGITAMNHSYNVAPKDGTMMSVIHAEVLFETLLSPGVKFNAKDYNYIGRFADADFVGVTSKRSAVKTLDDAKKRQVTMGSTGRRSVTFLGPAMFNRVAGTQFKVITGYPGTSDIDLALERGEVDGVALSWAAVTSVYGQKYANGDIVPVFAVADGRMKAIPDVPSITEFGRDENEKTFLGIYTSSGTIGRALAFPPGVPADRVAALRDAFEKTIRDPEFLAEVKSKSILFDPMSGPDLQAYVDKYMKTLAARVDAAQKIYNELLAAP
ncbi:MAG TPA: tripartite tricarboxylate transporter substrate-binding protein [Xanthobacteraceae bacterium]|nr:tripartite tricarboxylate transporter substrate-binding protein [Xanthobacteraceae bacterium]